MQTIYFTTSSKKYFDKNGLQLLKTIQKFSKRKIIIYSEDMQPEVGDQYEIRSLNEAKNIATFQNSFREKYPYEYRFMPYSARMDIWVFKIATIKQFIEEHAGYFGIYLDSDSVVLNDKFDGVLDDFVLPAKKFDIGLFRRINIHLHPESGVLTLNVSEKIHNVYSEILERVYKFDFLHLPSWTDCSFINEYLINHRLAYLDFCEVYNLKTDNPVYESNLIKSFIHMKGGRKGKYSFIRHLRGKYK